MEIKWVAPDEVPVETRRGPSYYAKLAKRLADYPGQWAVWSEYMDSARFYEFRKRFPQLEFRKQRVAPRTATSKNPKYKVYARYVAS